MPTYEYLCKECSHRFEQWQKMIDEPLSICPACGGTIRRVYYPAGIVFKGSGFYKTDHSKSSSSPSNGHAPKSESGAAEGGSTSENKPPTPAASGSKGTDAAQDEAKVTAPTPK